VFRTHHYPRINDPSQAYIKTTQIEYKDQKIIDTYTKTQQKKVYETSYKTGIHNDVLGFTQCLLNEGKQIDTETRLAANRNVHIHLEDWRNHAKLLGRGDSVDWAIWQKLVFHAHLNC